MGELQSKYDELLSKYMYMKKILKKINKNILKSTYHCAPHPGRSFTFQYLVASKWGQDTIKTKYMIVGLWP